MYLVRINRIRATMKQNLSYHFVENCQVNSMAIWMSKEGLQSQAHARHEIEPYQLMLENKVISIYP